MVDELKPGRRGHTLDNRRVRLVMPTQVMERRLAIRAQFPDGLVFSAPLLVP